MVGVTKYCVGSSPRDRRFKTDKQKIRSRLVRKEREWREQNIRYLSTVYTLIIRICFTLPSSGSCTGRNTTRAIRSIDRHVHHGTYPDGIDLQNIGGYW